MEMTGGGEARGKAVPDPAPVPARPTQNRLLLMGLGHWV